MPVTRQRQREINFLNMPGTEVTKTELTLVSESVPFPPFSGDGSESVHDFIRRVQEECTRRNVTSDEAKLAVIKSRISFESNSLAGRLAKSDKFLQFKKYDEFTTELLKHFAGHSKLGATHTLLRVAQSTSQVIRSVPDVFKAENFASSLGSELATQLKDTNWFTDEQMSLANFQRIMSYFLFILQLDAPTFAVASKVELTPSDFIYDICKKIIEKGPPADVPVHLAQPPPPQPRSSHGSSHVPQLADGHSHTRGRSSSRHPHPQNLPRFFRQSSHRPRSQSRHLRDRNSSCHRCGLRGHIASFCRVSLDENGAPQFDPDAFCSLHNRRGHSLADCRLYKQQQLAPRQSYSPSGNGQRHSQFDHT